MMEQKFVKLEDAVKKLGVPAEKLNELREAGELRAYRDGSSWKFRGDEIEKMMTEGLPEPAPPSDLGISGLSGLSLADDSELEASSPLEIEEDSALELAPISEATDEPAKPAAPSDSEDLALASSSDLDLDLGSLDDAQAADSNQPEPQDKPQALEEPDSILLSEEELGESMPAPASTIIGKNELGLDDADLELATEEPEGSELDLASDSAASDVLSSGIAGSGVLDELTAESGGSSAFEGLDELELDLEAESSRILSPEDAAKVKDQAGDSKQTTDSDLTLDTGSDLKLSDDDDLSLGSDLSLDLDDQGTDPVPEELELELAGEVTHDEPQDEELELELAASDSAVGDSDIDLDGGSDDFVLAGGSDSDVSLHASESGINLVDPSDSGLALDDISLDMGDSAILSSLSLGGGSELDMSLVADSDAAASGQQPVEVLAEEDFQLTPITDGATDDDPDSSSQVIALDAGMEDLAASGIGVLGDDAFAEDLDQPAMLEEGAAAADDFSMGAYAGAGASAGAAAVRADDDFGVLATVGLAACGLFCTLAVLMLGDMIRNIWSWDQPTALSSSLLESLLGIFGLK